MAFFDIFRRKVNAAASAVCVCFYELDEHNENKEERKKKNENRRIGTVSCAHKMSMLCDRERV